MLVVQQISGAPFPSTYTVILAILRCEALHETPFVTEVRYVKKMVNVTFSVGLASPHTGGSRQHFLELIKGSSLRLRAAMLIFRG